MYVLKIKEYRDERKWSQEKLAIKSGVSQSQISYIENLEKSPSIYTIAKIGMAFGVCPHDLVRFNFLHTCSWNCNK